MKLDIGDESPVNFLPYLIVQFTAISRLDISEYVNSIFAI